jgi:hypothetical protein
LKIRFRIGAIFSNAFGNSNSRAQSSAFYLCRYNAFRLERIFDTNFRAAALMTVIENELLAAVFEPILLLFAGSFAIFDKVGRLAMPTADFNFAHTKEISCLRSQYSTYH